MPEFFARLRFARRMLIIMAVLALVFSGIGLFSILILLANAINAIEPIREPTAWRIMMTSLGLALAGLVAGLVYLKMRRPGMAELARLVESSHPDLKESFSTAVELYLRQGGASDPLQAALFRSVEAQVAEIDLRKAARPRLLHPLGVIGIIFSALLLSDFAGSSRLVEKARYYQMDRQGGEASGLVVEPGEAEIPINDDLTVTATVHRWEVDPHIVYERDGRQERHPMHRSADGIARFTLYGLEEATRYHVETSSLISESYTVSVYEPPRYEAIEIEVLPPDYTREEAAVFERLIDLVVPEGSRLRLAIVPSGATEAAIKAYGEERAMSPADSSEWLQTEFTALTDGSYQLLLRDADGRLAVSPVQRIEVAPDTPPTVEITEPGRDSQARPDGVVPLSLFAGDDYGISRVEIRQSLSGLPRKPLVIYEAESKAPLERELSSAIELSRLSAEHGDVVTYYAVAWDNREPEPQVARSEVYFIEVLTDVPEQEADDPESQEGGEGPPEEINLRAIAVELKRLIRESFKAELKPAQERESTQRVLAADINAVKNETAGILAKIGGMLLQVEGGVIYEVFRNSLVKMDEAERSFNGDALAEAIPALEESLSNILLVESYLKSLPQMQEQSGGSGGSSPQQSNAQGESAQDGEGAEQESPSIGEMQAQLESLRRLMDAQAERNRDYQSAEGQSLSGAEREKLEGSQAGVANQLSDAIEALRQLDESYGIRKALKEARSEMKTAGEGAGSGEFAQAVRYGLRARETMGQAAEALDERIRAAAAASLDQLVEGAGQLTEAQQAAAAASAAAQGGADKAAAMRAEQAALQDELAGLQQAITRQAVELESVFPEIAQSLGAAYQGSRRANTEGEMQRAQNALLYERFSRAERHQEAASEQLEALQADLKTARGQLPGLTRSALERLLEDVAAARQRVNQAEKSGERPEVSETGRRLGSAGRALSDRELVELGSKLEATSEGEGGGLTQRQMVPALEHAASILRDYLVRENVEHRLRLNQEGAPPPEKYRKLVEEYFRNLAEE